MCNPAAFHVSARNLDYSEEMSTWVGQVPARTMFRSLLPPTRTGVRPLTWTTCYSYVTMITLPRRLAELPTAPFLDSLPQSARAIGVAGLNERGLSVAALWDDPAQLPTSSEYFQAGQSQAALNVVEFLLGSCETVSEVQDALSENLVWSGVSCFGKE